MKQKSKKDSKSRRGIDDQKLSIQVASSERKQTFRKSALILLHTRQVQLEVEQTFFFFLSPMQTTLVVGVYAIPMLSSISERNIYLVVGCHVRKWALISRLLFREQTNSQGQRFFLERCHFSRTDRNITHLKINRGIRSTSTQHCKCPLDEVVDSRMQHGIYLISVTFSQFSISLIWVQFIFIALGFRHMGSASLTHN